MWMEFKLFFKYVLRQILRETYSAVNRYYDDDDHDDDIDDELYGDDVVKLLSCNNLIVIQCWDLEDISNT